MATDGAGTPPIHVVWGAGLGPTGVASYDAALADANVHNYNLVSLSSVVPPGAPVEPVGTAPPLGPVGARLWTVQARSTAEGPGRAAAALGWATGPDGGVFYEAGGRDDGAAAREEVREGLAAARTLRDAELPEEHVESASIEVPADAFGTAVVLAAYGEAEPLG